MSRALFCSFRLTVETGGSHLPLFVRKNGKISRKVQRLRPGWARPGSSPSLAGLGDSDNSP